jgi:TonB family protein
MRPLETWLLNYAVNALWQVPLVFAAAWLAARASRRAGPASQHTLWTTALITEVVLPACSARPDQAIITLLHWLTSFHQRTAPQAAQVTITTGPVRAVEGLQLAPALLAAVALLYLAALVYFITRLSLGLHQTASLRRRAEPIALTGHASQSYHRFAQLFSVTDAIVATSAEIASPITLGIRRPVLLLPSDLDINLLREDLDAALAHEFAHMRRSDFAKNLAYEVLSLPIAFHPLLHLTRRHMAESRELICDDMAANAVAGRQRYAHSLLRLATAFSQHARATTPHAIGIFEANPFQNFERRVMNLTHHSPQLRGTARFATAALSLFLIAGACTSALAFRMQVAAPQTQTPPPPAQTTTAATAPASFVLAIPRPTTGQPKQSFKVEIPDTPAGANNLPPGSYTLKILTPTSTEPAQTGSDRTVSVSSSDLGGNIRNHPEPVYPADAKAAHIQGTVLLDAVIGKDGNISSLKLLSGPPQLTKAAWDAVSRWTYTPFLFNGKPTEVETTITVNFTLNPQASPEPAPASSPSASNTRQNPIVIKSSDAIFPASAKASMKNFNGTVLVSLVVGKDGLPKNVAISKSLRPDFDQSALAAVSQYRFEPALRNGQPVETPLYIDVNFQKTK